MKFQKILFDNYTNWDQQKNNFIYKDCKHYRK